MDKLLIVARLLIELWNHSLKGQTLCENEAAIPEDSVPRGL